MEPASTQVLIGDAFRADATVPEETARRIIAEDPVARGGFARGELRPYQVGFLRGRD